MPRDLDPDARKVWRHVLREMAGTGVITAADRDILRVYCEAVASYVRNHRLLRESGALVRGSRGRDLVKSPLHQIVREDRDAVRLLARELGLSPSARVGLRTDLSGPVPSIEDLIGPAPRYQVVAEPSSREPRTSTPSPGSVHGAPDDA